MAADAPGSGLDSFTGSGTTVALLPGSGLRIAKGGVGASRQTRHWTEQGKASLNRCFPCGFQLLAAWHG
jgi:hypothetical protein